MMHKKLKLNDVCEFVGGSQPPKSEFSSVKLSGYVRLIQIRDYKTNEFLTYISKDSTKKFCNTKDIMIGRYGPPIFQILRGLEGAYNVALMKAIPKENIDNDYLFYFLSQEHLFNYIDGLSPRTGGQTGVDVTMLKEYPITLPNINYQSRVAEILRGLDLKIELNNKINVELEAMAKLIYDYWFVQFDFPDAKGKPYKSFGGQMVYNEELKREIPKGWEVKELSEIANITMGQSPSGSSYNDSGEGTIFFQGSTDFGYRFPSVRQYTTEPSRLAKIGDILLSVRAPVGTLNIADNDCCIGRGLAALNSKDNANSFLFYVMLYFKQIFDRRNTSGTTFGSITKDDLFSLKLVYPTSDVLNDYDSKVADFNSKIFNNHQQNKELIQLRDWLLPMLMNGQATVKNA